MILLLILVFIRYYIDRGRLLFCPCSGCQAASLTELGVGYAWENSPLRLVRHCGPTPRDAPKGNFEEIERYEYSFAPSSYNRYDVFMT